MNTQLQSINLHRSRSDRMIGGVCGGLAARFHLDPTLVRIGTAVAALFSFGAVVALYLACWILIPSD